jgi:hypothetical protein
MPFEINPRIFTSHITLKKYHLGAGGSAPDSSYVANMRFETADSTTASVGFWNADSSNLFVKSGNYNRADYGVWTFEALGGTDTAAANRRYVMPLRVLDGSAIRFVYTATSADCVIVINELYGWH